MNITVIGAGTIGVSWTGLFLAHGHRVTVHDVADDADERVRTGLDQIVPTLAALGLPTDDLTASLRFEPSLAAAVGDVDIVQENGPDRLGFKRKLWAEVEKHVPRTALLLSSSSGLTASMQSGGMKDASRLLIGHPFNPPHLVPLVEVVPGKHTAPDAVTAAADFYRSLGKKAVTLHKEIPGFVANRLQAALMRESVALVRAGVVDVDELDEIVTASVGQRWSVSGPFESFHLGGGPNGFRGWLDHFSRGMQLLWLHSAVKPVFFTPGVRRLLLRQIDDTFGDRPIVELEAERDRRQVDVLDALRDRKDT